MKRINQENSVTHCVFSLFMAARQLCWLPTILFYCCSFFFLLLNLRGRLDDRHQTLPRLVVTWIYNIRSEIWVAPPPEIWRPKNIKFRCNYAQLWDLITNISRTETQQDIVNQKRHC